MKNKNIVAIGLGVLAALAVSCIAETPQEPTENVAETPSESATPGKVSPFEIDENAVDVPAPSSDIHTQPKSLGINPIGGSCVTPLSGYCAPANIYGTTESGTLKCYCKCNAAVGGNASGIHPDCAAMPTARQCGTLFDVYQPDPAGGPGNFSYTFKPTGQPFACHKIGDNLAPSVP